MTQARRTLISLADTPYYHCVTRCVRRAFLCGKDPESPRSFDHRKVWLVERFKFLASVFAIDICAYAVMSNHYHLVLFVDKSRIAGWTDEDVMDRWEKLFPCSAQNLRSRLEMADSAVARHTLQQTIQEWRERLADISWFMKCLNEYLARRSNKEDNCKGHFWEARFTSQALLDQHALLACMAYVDLNPVRAGMALAPEDSDFTSIQERLVDYAEELTKSQQSARQGQLIRHFNSYYRAQKGSSPKQRINYITANLKPFGGSSRTPLSDALPYTLEDYFQLVDCTGRVIRQDKRGAIPKQLPDLLSRIGCEQNSWLESVQGFLHRYGHVAGNLMALREYEERSDKKGIKGIGLAQSLTKGMAA